MKPNRFLFRVLLSLLLAMTAPARAATIPGLFNTGVDNNRALLANGAVDPHYRLIQSADGSAAGPNALVITDTLFPIVGTGPWLASGPNSKWIGPMANQSTGNLPGDYKYRLTFDLTGLEPSTAVITGRWTSDNAGPDILLNGLSTGFTSDGNFPAINNTFTITNGFVDGMNTLDFIVNNAGAAANPTGFRAELSGAADLKPPPGTPPTITAHPASQSIGIGESVTFSVGASGSRPFAYQWRFNGTPISGATNGSYTINGVTGANAGSYDVIVSNSAGSATSNPATLTVIVLSPAQLTYEPAGPSSRRTGLTFSEIMYHPTNRADGRNLEFIELYNSNPYQEDVSGCRVTGDADYTIPNGTIIPGLGYLVIAPVPADVQAAYGIGGVLGGFTNNLPNDSGTVRLRKKSGGLVLEVNYSDEPPWPAAGDGTGHSLVLVRPSYGEGNPPAWAASAVKGGSPGAADPVPAGPLENVVINEILAHTDPPLFDYLELHNHSLLAVDLSGCWLSDDAATNKFQIPPTVLPPGGFVSFDETQLGFALAADGETVYFVNAAQTRVLDGLRFGGQANGVAFGRYPDGGPAFQRLATRTPDLPNSPPLARDIVINEIMFNPISGDDDDQFVELYNRSGGPVNIGGGRLLAGIGYTFPANTMVPPNGYVVVAKNTAKLMTNYTGLTAANLFGNFSGKLAHGGERLALALPDFGLQTNAQTQAVTTNAFSVVVDEVIYGDGGRWGKWSDGGGGSLELIDPDSDNRLAPNWADSDSAANSAWTTVEVTGVLDNGFPTGLPDQLQVFLQGAGEALVDDVEVVPAGGANRLANPNFEGGLTGWFPQGTQRLTYLETNGGFNSARCLHLVASERGDHVANRVRAPLSSALSAGTTATLRAKVKWLRGHPEILFRIKGGHLELVARLAVPARPGTPGAVNSRALVNAGPAITEVAHRPVLPQAGQNIRVTARVGDPDGVQSVVLKYRLDPATTLSTVTMTDDGLNGDLLAGDGIYTGIILGQPTGTLIAFRVQATDGFTPSAATQFPDDAPARECLVRVGDATPAGAFGTYRFWMTAANISFWTARERMSNEGLDATFVYGNHRVVYNAQAHYSGSSYTAPIYTGPLGALCGYDLAFPPDDLVFNEDHFTLDWPIRDDTNQREQLMYWTLEQFGLPNMYRRYINLYVNGQKRGTIYDDVQQPDGDALKEFFSDDSEGDLYKTDCWNEFDDAGSRIDPCILNSLEIFNTTGGVKKAARYRWNWRPRALHGTANDFTNLFALVDAMNTQGAGYQSAVECVADVEHWMRTFCMNDLASFWDAFGNPNAKNTYLYKPERGGWKLLSWDFDVGFGVFNDPVNLALFPALGDTAMNRFYTQPVWLRAYWRAMDEALNTFFVTGAGTAIDAVLDSKYAAFQANGITLASPAAIKTWINGRRAFLQGQLATVAANFAVSNPPSFTTNRNLVTLAGTAPVQAQTITVNGIPYPVTWTSVTGWRTSVPVTNGTQNLVVTGLDRLGNSVATATVSVTYTGADESPIDTVVINEIMYNPVVPEASYVEIFNTSASYAFDLSGWELNGVDFNFPPGTILAGGQFFIIAKNKAVFAKTYGSSIPVLGEFNGQLDDGGETLTLLTGTNSGPCLVVDRVTYDDDPPWPAGPDGRGRSLQVIDPRQDNSRVSNWGETTGWRFYSYTGAGGASATRFYLYLDSPGDVYLDNIALVPGAVAGVGSNYLPNGNFESPLTGPWRVLGNHLNSAISGAATIEGTGSLHIVASGVGSATACLYQDPVGIVSTTTYTLSFWYLPTTNGNGLNYRLSSAFRTTNALSIRPILYTPGANNNFGVTLPPFAPLWLSEVEPLNLTGLLDNSGDRDPWIEIHHSGSNALSLDGYALANNFSNLTQWPFPPGTMISPDEFKIIWADAEPDETADTNLHASFRLDGTNGSVVLARTVNGAAQMVDFLNYSGVAGDRSFGSSPPGQTSYRQVFHYVTPGGTNDPASPPVTLFINEWMAANVSYLRDPSDRDYDDWFEIWNPTTNRVDLTDFTLTDTLSDPAKFRIPSGYGIGPRGYLLVWADEEGGQSSTNGELHVNFKLSQSGESLGLYAPDGRVADAVTFGAQTNNVSQGRWPDGAAAPFRFMPTPTPRAANVIPTLNPRILSIALNGNVVTVTWLAQPGRTYRVQIKNDLNAPAWNDLPDDLTATGNSASRDDTLPEGVNQRFYQVLVVQ